MAQKCLNAFARKVGKVMDNIIVCKGCKMEFEIDPYTFGCACGSFIVSVEGKAFNLCDVMWDNR